MSDQQDPTTDWEIAKEARHPQMLDAVDQRLPASAPSPSVMKDTLPMDEMPEAEMTFDDIAADPLQVWRGAAKAPQTVDERLRELTEYAGIMTRKNKFMANALKGARYELEGLHERIKELTTPPLSQAIVVNVIPMERRADVNLVGRIVRVTIDPAVVASTLRVGQQVLLNENSAIIGLAPTQLAGEIVTVKERKDDGTVLVLARNDEEIICTLADDLRTGEGGKYEGVRVGDALVVDLRAKLALRKIARPEVEELLLEEVPDVTYWDIGGLGEQIEQIRDAVELPFKHPDVYREHRLRPPRGVLLYGPPGCGKTLIAKAVAASLGQDLLSEDDGASASAKKPAVPRSYFLNVKGPQLLNKYVGETERQIRMIFARAREKAALGIPVVIFFDEMEALFRTRGTGRSSDVETTVVPQLLSEIDGVEALENVVIIGASNREDMIDPAILRPGRLDVKIRISRPDYEGACQILAKYLVADLPLSDALVAETGSREAATKALIRDIADALFDRRPDNARMRVTYVNGEVEDVYVADLVSGAMLANIVDRAKKLAIKELLGGGARGMARAHVRAAVALELSENEDLEASATPEEWARVAGRRGVRVVGIEPLGKQSLTGT
ncbi:MAG: proteasome ATPase [Actinomycetaceae bacterium]|nr:proteasome ATPase [Actinomycetaceae bacterium]